MVAPRISRSRLFGLSTAVPRSPGLVSVFETSNEVGNSQVLDGSFGDEFWRNRRCLLLWLKSAEFVSQLQEMFFDEVP